MKPDTVATFLVIACLSGCAYFAKADGMPTDIPNKMLLPDPYVQNGCDQRINPVWPTPYHIEAVPMPKKHYTEIPEPNLLILLLSGLAVYFICLTYHWAVHRNEHK